MDAEPLASVEGIERVLTPGQCAQVLACAAAFRLMDPDPRLDRLLREDAGHQAFVYAVSAVARRAGRE